MKKIVYSIAVFALLLMSAGKVSAQMGSFLDYNPDAHVTGMGNAGAAMYATAFSMWNNTASTVFSDNNFDAAVSYGMWQPSSFGNNVISVAGYGKVARFMTISAGVKYFMYKPMTMMDDKGSPLGTFSPKEMTAGVGLAFKILPILSASANISYVMSDMVSGKGNAVSADFGVMMDLKFMRIGLTAANIGSKLNYGTESAYSLPANLKLGVGTTQVFAEDHALTASLQGGMVFDNSSFFAELGLEYMYNDLFRVSAGYHYGDGVKSVPSYASAGIGVSLWGVNLNASYLIGVTANSPISNSFLIGLGYSF